MERWSNSRLRSLLGAASRKLGIARLGRNLHPSRRPGRIVAALALVTAVTTLFATTTAFGNLTGSPSNFESNDGDMIATTGADWNCFTSVTGQSLSAANIGTGCTGVNTASFQNLDESAGDPSTDQQWKSGQKQDTQCPTLTTGTAPNKDNFTYVATYSDVGTTGLQNGHPFLYGATTRTAANGNASENIELNQLKTTCTNNSPMPRTAGDKLIAIDYVGGGTDPTKVNFNVLTWLTTGNKGDCNVSATATPPCWSVAQSTTAAEGSVNPNEILPAANGLDGQDELTNMFAEFGIDLTAANIVPAGTCNPFAQAVFESRTSGSSFSSNPEDIEIIQNPFQTCGSVSIHKQDDLGNALSGAVFTLYKDNTPFGSENSGTQTSHGAEDTITTLTCTTLATGNCTISNVPFGDYWIVETTTPNGYATAADQPVAVSATSPASGTVFTFVDPRLFKIITLVCRESDNTLYGAKVAYGAKGSTTLPTLPASNNTATTLSGVSSVSTLCSTTTAGADADQQSGSYPVKVGIP